jgi:hypothetical protein
VSFTVRGQTRIPAGELREAELTWHSLGERGGPLGEPLDGDFHLRVEAKIRAGLRRPVFVGRHEGSLSPRRRRRRPGHHPLAVRAGPRRRGSLSVHLSLT